MFSTKGIHPLKLVIENIYIVKNSHRNLGEVNVYNPQYALN